MRARNIKPGFFKNAELADAGLSVRLLFIGLWCMADREGRLKDKPRVIKAEIFPYDRDDEVDVDAGLNTLERLGLIHRYSTGADSVDASCIISISSFKKHQSPHHTEKASVLPAPVKSRLRNGEYPSDSLIPDSLNHESLIPVHATVHPEKIATNVASGPGPEKNGSAGGGANGHHDEAYRTWREVAPALADPDLQKRFDRGSKPIQVIGLMGGWRELGMKPREMRGQIEVKYLAIYRSLP